jgi:hypothetical protein
MKLSKHAEQRCQMRGIPSKCHEIVLRYGSPVPCPGGVTAYHLTAKDRRAAMDDCRKLLQVLDRARDTAIVVGGNGTCVTAYKNPKRSRRR